MQCDEAWDEQHRCHRKQYLTFHAKQDGESDHPTDDDGDAAQAAADHQTQPTQPLRRSAAQLTHLRTPLSQYRHHQIAQGTPPDRKHSHGAIVPERFLSEIPKNLRHLCGTVLPKGQRIEHEEPPIESG
jgi:hypothetical protein